MKIGILAANNIRYSPYIFFYSNILDDMGIDYELAIPDRNDVQDSFRAPVHILPWKRNGNTLLNYMQYSAALKKLVRKQGYDALIVLTTNNAAFCAGWLKREYAGRYIVDIRDYTHENIKMFYRREGKAVRNSCLNVISSAKFKSFLPEAVYHVCHNTVARELFPVPAKEPKQDRIVIGYLGVGGYAQQCRALMRLVAGDDRFELHFHCQKTLEENLRDLTEELDCGRILFKGPYTPAEKEQIILETDILFNAYGNGSPLLDCALSNKLYEAYRYVKPILTSPGTYMTEMAGPLAMPIDLTSARDLNDIYDRYRGLQPDAAMAFAGEKLEAVVRENDETGSLIRQSLRNLST